MSYRIAPLEARHDRSAFSCGVKELDDYFHARAGQDIRRRLASCFVMVADDGSIAGYYTLSATSIALSDLPATLAGKLPRYPTIPATLLGRLAVDRKYRSQGLGEALLYDAFAKALRSEIASFAFVVDAKNEAARAFYERYQFVGLSDFGTRMFVPLSEIAKLFA